MRKRQLNGKELGTAMTENEIWLVDVSVDFCLSKACDQPSQSKAAKINKKKGKRNHVNLRFNIEVFILYLQGEIELDCKHWDLLCKKLY